MIEPDLELIAATLEGFEESILHRLIDRAQFKANRAVYEPGRSGFRGDDTDSLFDLRLRYTEEMDALFGRFHAPEERPFSADLPRSRRAVNLPPDCLRVNDVAAIDLTAQIRTGYLELVRAMCEDGDDGQHGSSVEHDVHALQAIARRVHFGALYVGEAKYRSSPEEYRALADARDEEAILALLTRRDVEEAILGRVQQKVAALQAQVNPKVRKVVNPAAVLDFYREYVIPLTKRGEVMYLLNRPSEH